MTEEIIKMKCPDDACNQDHRNFKESTEKEFNAIKDDVKEIKKVLNTKLNRTAVIVLFSTLSGIIVMILLYCMGAWAEYKQFVNVNTNQIDNHKESIIRINQKLDRIQDQQIAFKDDIIRAIRRGKHD